MCGERLGRRATSSPPTTSTFAVHDAPRRRGDAARQREQRVFGVARRRARVVLAARPNCQLSATRAPRGGADASGSRAATSRARGADLAVAVRFLLEGVRASAAPRPRLAPRL